MIVSVEHVASFAIGAHRDQVDKNEVPYRHHLRAVAEGLEPFGPMLEMAGWLHDIIEDTSWTADLLRDLGISARVVEIVERVTRTSPGEDYQDMIRSVTEDPLATLVKIADNAHNSRPERNAAIEDEERRRELVERYREARKILWPATSTENVIKIVSRVNPALLKELSSD